MAFRFSCSRLRFLVLALALCGGGSLANPARAQLVRATTTNTTTSTTLIGTSSPTVDSTSTALVSAAAVSTDFVLERVPVVARQCTQAELDVILETAGRGNESATVDCSFSFSPPVRITKKLLFTGNTQGVTVDCNGSAIDGGPGTYLYDNGDRGANIVEIVSTVADETGPLRWTARPQDITIRNCEIIGSARIWPLNLWVEGNLDRQAALSRQPGYVSTIRANAPRGVRFEDVLFRAQKYTPLYVGPGVTETTVTNSQFVGGARGVIVYFDAESSRNELLGNAFYARSDLGDHPREIIALDGSDHNRIIGNYFSALAHGGIWLYRNCGEDKVVRFTTPSHNQIINNVFYYDQYDGDSGSYYSFDDIGDPAVFLGSRNDDRDYCDDDDDFAGGSGSDNRSHATYNVVMQNQIYKRPLDRAIMTRWSDVNVPNYVAYNETVQSHLDRPSGCYVASAYGQFLRDGEATRLVRSGTGTPVCSERRQRCDDGQMTTESTLLASCQIDRMPFSCAVSGDNRGCTGSSICPSGTTHVRTVAACNLEYGTVSTSQLDSIRGNDARVVRTSDRESDGSCNAGSASVSSGESVIERAVGGGRVYFGCSEHDENGGDCHVRGELYCQNERPLSSSMLGSGSTISIQGTR